MQNLLFLSSGNTKGFFAKLKDGFEKYQDYTWTLYKPINSKKFYVRNGELGYLHKVTEYELIYDPFLWDKVFFTKRQARKLEELFANTVENNGCLELNQRNTNFGYARTKFLGKEWLAHRLICFLLHPNFDKDLNCLHKCDNPKCINPDHLYQGLQKDNVQDAMNRNRIPVGERSKNSKLTESQVYEIKKMFHNGASLHEIYKKFDVVCKTQIWRIIKGYRWKHVK